MSHIGAIARLKTGDYNVTRTVEGTWVDGGYTPGSSSVFPIVASLQPMPSDGQEGLTLLPLAQGEHAEESQVVYTTTELKTRVRGFEPDQVEIRGELWRVRRVSTWVGHAQTYFRAIASRVVVP